jgi:hypothetical protein
MKCLRSATARVAISDDRAVAEGHADIRVIGTHAAQRAAKYAKEGDYEKAQLEARAAQRFMLRNADVDKQSQFSNQVEQIDQVLRSERRREKASSSASSASSNASSKKKSRMNRTDAAASAFSNALESKFD